MKTFAERYGEAHGCAATEFCRRVFWSTLHRRALPWAPLLLLSGYFAADRALISACGHARSLCQVQEETECFRRDPQNAGWLRRRLRLRVSVRRLRRVAAQCFATPEPAANSVSIGPVPA